MASAKKLPDDETLLQLARDEGLTNQQIGDRYGTTGEAVRQQLAKLDFRRGPERPSHAHYLPWRIRADHVGDVLARRLRAYSKRQQGRKLSPTEDRLLDEWLKWMDGANPWGIAMSVHYDRMDGDGFWLEARQPGDRDYISPPEAA